MTATLDVWKQVPMRDFFRDADQILCTLGEGLDSDDPWDAMQGKPDSLDLDSTRTGLWTLWA